MSTRKNGDWNPIAIRVARVRRTAIANEIAGSHAKLGTVTEFDPGRAKRRPLFQVSRGRVIVECVSYLI